MSKSQASSPAFSPSFSNEAKVGALVVGTLVLALLFAWAIGVQNPFNSTLDFYVTYNFAGGIEVGSPVRVSGIKVGRVEQIEFFVPNDPKKVALQEPGSDDYAHPSNSARLAAPEGPGAGDDLARDNEKALAPLRLKISVRKDAARGIRQDSRFYVNLAGIIGERYIEVTPGHQKLPAVKPGEVVAGVDPPRIDQLISQSFDLAGKLKEIIDENKGDITKSIDLLYKLSGNLNKTLGWIDHSAIFKTDLSKLIVNLIAITTDVRKVTDKTASPEGEKTLRLLYDLLWRLEPLDSQNIRLFLQKEGVKVHIF